MPVWSLIILPLVGSSRAINPRTRLPQLRTHERLGAMKVGRLDRDPNHKLRRAPLGRAGGDIGWGLGQDGRSVHAQGLVEAGDQEQQSDLSRGYDVLERVEAIVAGRVRDQQFARSIHLDESRFTAARRGVGVVATVSRRKNQERRQLDEPSTVNVERCDLLPDCALLRCRVQLAKSGERFDGHGEVGTVRVGGLDVRFEQAALRLALRSAAYASSGSQARPSVGPSGERSGVAVRTPRGRGCGRLRVPACPPRRQQRARTSSSGRAATFQYAEQSAFRASSL